MTREDEHSYDVASALYFHIPDVLSLIEDISQVL